MLAGKITLHTEVKTYTPPPPPPKTEEVNRNLPVPTEFTYACTKAGVEAALKQAQARYRIGDRVYVLSEKASGTVQSFYSVHEWLTATKHQSVMETVVRLDNGELKMTHFKNLCVLADTGDEC